MISRPKAKQITNMMSSVHPESTLYVEKKSFMIAQVKERPLAISKTVAILKQ